MKNALLLLAVAVAAGWWWVRRRRPPPAEAFFSDAQAQPKAVVLIEPGEDPEPRDRPTRTGETQALKRKVVHGPYRPIEDRGVPSVVQPEKR